MRPVTDLLLVFRFAQALDVADGEGHYGGIGRVAVVVASMVGTWSNLRTPSKPMSLCPMQARMSVLPRRKVSSVVGSAAHVAEVHSRSVLFAELGVEAGHRSSG